MAKEFVRIQSDTTITVTSGLQYVDSTDKESHLDNRLKVAASWPKMTVEIKQGKGVYPAEIASWPTVKSLEKDGILTIGQFIDDPETDEQKQVKEKLVEELKAHKAEIKKATLSDLVKEDKE